MKNFYTKSCYVLIDRDVFMARIVKVHAGATEHLKSYTVRIYELEGGYMDEILSAHQLRGRCTPDRQLLVSTRCILESYMREMDIL